MIHVIYSLALRETVSSADLSKLIKSVNAQLFTAHTEPLLIMVRGDCTHLEYLTL